MADHIHTVPDLLSNPEIIAFAKATGATLRAGTWSSFDRFDGKPCAVLEYSSERKAYRAHSESDWSWGSGVSVADVDEDAIKLLPR